MSLKKLLESWKYPLILLLMIGVSNIGAWIYLIALNLIVLDMTKSPLAVSALYILKPVATLCTNVWAGSLIDRLNKRNLMVFFDLFRAICIACLPFLSSLWLIYSLVFFINMAGSIFEPTSMTYMTKLIPSEQRQRFNSLRSLIGSGAFLIGPAIAGTLFMIGTPMFAIYINALALLMSGVITMFMPDLEKRGLTHIVEEELFLEVLKKDWSLVINYSRRHIYIVSIYFLFSCMMVMITAVDSLEAAFSKEVLFLSNGEYGFLVSIAGAGVIVGAMINTMFAKKLATSLLIGLGSLVVSAGYIIYAFSNDFFMAAVGFFILSFSLAFANTGFYTFYQNNIPVDIMGRIGSIYQFIEAILIIIVTSIFGVAAQMVSIQTVIMLGTLTMLVVTILLCAFSLQKSKTKYWT